MPSSDHEAIASLLALYEKALNTSDLPLTMSIWTQDGVFIQPGYPSHIGTAAIKKAYTGLYALVEHNVHISVEEVQIMSADWAFARTRVSGNVVFAEDGRVENDTVQQLLVLKREGDGWKIARYSFSPMA